MITTAQLRTCRLDSRARTVRVRSGHLHRLHRGVYAVGHRGVTRDGHFLAAVLACGARACLSHFARTLLDLAAVLPERTLRRAARQAQVDRRASARQIVELANRSNGHRGAGKLLAAVADGPTPTRSELEDILLDMLDAAGVRRPEINVKLRLDGRTIEPDYLWRDRRLAIEADGATWHEHKLTRENDADKQAILEAHGYRVVRVAYQQAVARPQQTLARILAALGEG